MKDKKKSDTFVSASVCNPTLKPVKKKKKKKKKKKNDYFFFFLRVQKYRHNGFPVALTVLGMRQPIEQIAFALVIRSGDHDGADAIDVFCGAKRVYETAAYRN
jgi:hypothetical protein